VQKKYKKMSISIILLGLLWAVQTALCGFPINESHCIDELDVLWTSVVPNLPNANWSMASSVSYSPAADLLLIAGDSVDDPDQRTEGQSFVQAVAATNETHDFEWVITWDWENGRSPIDASLLRSATTVYAHPKKDIAVVLGPALLRGFKASTGEDAWSRNPRVKACVNGDDDDDFVTYDSAVVLPGDDNHIIVSGICNNSQTLVMDAYSLDDGSLVKRNNITIYKFLSGFASKINYGNMPPETSLSAPATTDVYHNVTKHKFFYLGVNHAVFTGLGRINIDDSYQAFVEWTESTFINPSFYSHRSVQATEELGLVTLLDPSFFDLLKGNGKHLTRYDLKKRGLVFNEQKVYSEYVWYGAHHKFNFKFDWTLADVSLTDRSSMYAITTPIPHSWKEIEDPFQKTFVSQHNTDTGVVTGGAQLQFTAADAVASPFAFDRTLFVVGYRLVPISDKTFKEKIKSKRFFRRTAVIAAVSTAAIDSTCVGCETMYYGEQCMNQCDCLNGYCSDDLLGSGECFCGFDTYGERCEPCMCDISSGLCNSGPDGDGWCKFCYDLDLKDESIHWATKYGKECDKENHCNTTYGVANPLGENGTDTCLFCNQTYDYIYGDYCNLTCECESHEECDAGVEGLGCVEKSKNHYDYGGITFGRQYWVYGLILTVLFLVFFFTTWILAIKAPQKMLPLLPSGALLKANAINEPLTGSIYNDEEDSVWDES
jgi:hypothetical protein